MSSATDPSKMLVKELKEALQARGLPRSGNKSVLQTRLANALATERAQTGGSFYHCSLCIAKADMDP